MKKRYVFDLDGTLLTSDFQYAHQILVDKFGDQALPFVQSIPNLLARYEKNFSRYDYDMLSRFLSFKTGLNLTPEIIREWDAMAGEMPSTEEEYARETLEYLKKNGKSLVVLTNWFGASQKERLKRADLLQYFDNVYGGDIATKPHKEAYYAAKSLYAPSVCLFVGNDAVTDYIGPRSYSMDSILYDKNYQYHSSLVKIKKLNELKKK